MEIQSVEEEDAAAEVQQPEVWEEEAAGRPVARTHRATSKSVRTALSDRPRLHSPALHPSMAILVAEAPLAFAAAASHALQDEQLWLTLSAHGLRHQSMLTAARQSGILARNLAAGDVSARSPAERACVLACDSCERGSRQEALRAVLSALLRLRVAVHVILLPEAATSSEAGARGAEEAVMGWSQAQVSEEASQCGSKSVRKQVTKEASQ